jgi:mono/diheme cytochrome c family protein
MALLGLGLAVTAAGAARAVGSGAGERAAIAQAAVAPVRAELLRDANALCASLTPSVAATLVPMSPPGTGCPQAAGEAFAGAAPSQEPRATIEAIEAKPRDLKIAGTRATGSFELVAVSRTATSGEAITYFGTLRLSLESQGGHWLVSSAARLAAAPDCVLEEGKRCAPGKKDLVFMLGIAEISPIGAGMPVPAAVRRAGRNVKAQFAAGRTALLQTGCLACHRIGSAGNRGPGGNLTHVGGRLSAGQIEAAIVHGKAPMPSFSRLPKRKLHDLVAFLTDLK